MMVPTMQDCSPRASPLSPTAVGVAVAGAARGGGGGVQEQLRDSAFRVLPPPDAQNERAKREARECEVVGAFQKKSFRVPSSL